MSVMLQAFYWDCPAKEKQEHNWWNFLAGHVEDLSRSGFNSLWLPPVSKAAETRSMGYDPYDYFDLGDLEQKGGKKTWFGNRGAQQPWRKVERRHSEDKVEEPEICPCSLGRSRYGSSERTHHEPRRKRRVPRTTARLCGLRTGIVL